MSTDNFWVITTYFNYAKYKSMLNNWHIFSRLLKEKGINLLTIELSFDGSFQLPEDPNIIRLTSSSVMWQKERLINYGLSLLPASCDKYAWVDCDVIFERDDWPKLTCLMLDCADIVQLFKRVYYLNNGVHEFSTNREDYSVMVQGVIWQNQTHKNWLERRKSKELPFSSPGFAWAARRDKFPSLYDRNIIGSGDTFLVDCLLGSWSIHGYFNKMTKHMHRDMFEWRKLHIAPKELKCAYLPQSICHLWHGSLKNRGYMDRHDLLQSSDFDPQTDIVLRNGVYEWNSNKPEFHQGIVDYFLNRREDDG